MNLTISLKLYAKIVDVTVWKSCINYKLTKITSNTKTCVFSENNQSGSHRLFNCFHPEKVGWGARNVLPGEIPRSPCVSIILSTSPCISQWNPKMTPYDIIVEAPVYMLNPFGDHLFLWMLNLLVHRSLIVDSLSACNHIQGKHPKRKITSIDFKNDNFLLRCFTDPPCLLFIDTSLWIM